jgi:hypothetical protein
VVRLARLKSTQSYMHLGQKSGKTPLAGVPAVIPALLHHTTSYLTPSASPTSTATYELLLVAYAFHLG